MKQWHFLMIGAHPDDPDSCAAGLSMHLVRNGHRVTFLSMTNGNAGHHIMDRASLRERRLHEMELAAQIYGFPYETLDIDDGALMPDLPTREKLTRYIRRLAPDVIITHRTNDYHPDHRACGQLVMDCSYMLGVPLFCPEEPPLRKPLHILSFEDSFTEPSPFRCDVAVPIDDVTDRKIAGMLAHESQYYEWLPWDGLWEPFLTAPDRAAQTAYLYERERARFAVPAQKHADMLPQGTKHAECFQVSEYGAPLT